jgi:hypothetical protein
MLIESGLPHEMWAEDVVMINYIRNCAPVSAHGKTPWEAFLRGEAEREPHEGIWGSGLYARAWDIEA